MKPGVRIVDPQQLTAVTGQAPQPRIPSFQVRAPHTATVPIEMDLLQELREHPLIERRREHIGVGRRAGRCRSTRRR